MLAKFLILHFLSSTQMLPDLADCTTSLVLKLSRSCVPTADQGAAPTLLSVQAGGLELSGKPFQLLQLKSWAFKLSRRG